MITERDLSETQISMFYEISPIRNIIGDLSGLLGKFCDEVIGSFYPNNIRKKSNVVITELVNNAISNSHNEKSKVTLEIRIDQNALKIRVMNSVDKTQFEKLNAHINMINTADDLKGLLAFTIRKKRAERVPGGLGLIRLAAENKFKLSLEYDDPFLTVASEFPMGGV